MFDYDCLDDFLQDPELIQKQKVEESESDFYSDTCSATGEHRSKIEVHRPELQNGLSTVKGVKSIKL